MCLPRSRHSNRGINVSIWSTRCSTHRATLRMRRWEVASQAWLACSLVNAMGPWPRFLASLTCVLLAWRSSKLKCRNESTSARTLVKVTWQTSIKNNFFFVWFGLALAQLLIEFIVDIMDHLSLTRAKAHMEVHRRCSSFVMGSCATRMAWNKQMHTPQLLHKANEC